MDVSSSIGGELRSIGHVRRNPINLYLCVSCRDELLRGIACPCMQYNSRSLGRSSIDNGYNGHNDLRILPMTIRLSTSAELAIHLWIRDYVAHHVGHDRYSLFQTNTRVESPPPAWTTRRPVYIKRLHGNAETRSFRPWLSVKLQIVIT